MAQITIGIWSPRKFVVVIQTAVLGLKPAIGLDTFVHLYMLNHFFHERQKSPFYLELR